MFDDLDQTQLESTDAEVFLNKLDSIDQLVGLFEVIEEPKIEEPVMEESKEESAVPAISVSGFEEESPGNTINDKFDLPKKLTLAEKLQKSVNKSIEASLTLNEFMFQNNLFAGDNGKMKDAFVQIGQAADLHRLCQSPTTTTMVGIWRAKK